MIISTIASRTSNRDDAMLAAIRLLLSTTAACWLGTASAREVEAEAEAERKVIDLRFRDFFRQPIGPKGLEIGEMARQADGRRVRLVGYIVRQEQPTPGRFMLTPRPAQMSEHADGEADDLPPSTVTVYLAAEQADSIVTPLRGLVVLGGRLHVGRHEAHDGRVSWLRLQLDPEAIRATNDGARVEIDMYGKQ